MKKSLSSCGQVDRRIHRYFLLLFVSHSDLSFWFLVSYSGFEKPDVTVFIAREENGIL